MDNPPNATKSSGQKNVQDIFIEYMNELFGIGACCTLPAAPNIAICIKRIFDMHLFHTLIVGTFLHLFDWYEWLKFYKLVI